MGFIKEFREFAMKGNLIDMAVGVVIGAAFGGVTKVFIDGIFMPLVGLIFKIGDMSSYTVSMGQTQDGKANLLMVGSFISTMINFIIVAFVMFMVIKMMNAMRKKEPAPAPPGPSKEEILLTEIRDLLKTQNNG